jgi:hypothetical protein
MKYIFAGDSWAHRGFTEQNYNYGNNSPMPDDVRLADHWGIEYTHALAPGKGNLSVMDEIISKRLEPTVPIIWVYTEPGRDYGRITGNSEFDWIAREDIFEIRKDLNKKILTEIRAKLPNPIALIGGLSDIDQDIARLLGFDVLHYSWQQWIAKKLNSQWFTFGWGASDIGWRADYNNIRPSRAATFAWDEQIKEWCWWEEQGYFCHEHPTPQANKEFAEFLKPAVIEWLTKYGQR